MIVLSTLQYLLLLAATRSLGYVYSFSVVAPFSVTPRIAGRALYAEDIENDESSSAEELPSLVSAPDETKKSKSNVRLAQEFVKSLFLDEKCLDSEMGVAQFGEACAMTIVYEDCFMPQPIVGKTPVTNHLLEKLNARKGKGTTRIDKISDGSKACGFTWTWVTDSEEGLRGTTYIELNDNGLVQYMREIPEPLYKPGDAIVEVLKVVTQDVEPKPKPPYQQQTPTTACEIVDYLFNTVQGSSIDESMRMFDDTIKYRDFNYEDLMEGKEEVRKFISDFNFPGIEFITQRIDDGIDSCCFTWEVAIADAPDRIKGISFYELNPETRKICYVRDIPESAIKPPILGKLARDYRPGLGVFAGVPLGSRPPL